MEKRLKEMMYREIYVSSFHGQVCYVPLGGIMSVVVRPILQPMKICTSQVMVAIGILKDTTKSLAV
ncbi:hypothetical protein D3C87_1387000 [compost metagenome]